MGIQHAWDRWEIRKKTVVGKLEGMDANWKALEKIGEY